MPVLYIIMEQKAPPKSGKGDNTISYPRCIYNRLVDTAEMAAHISKTSTISPADLIGTLYGLVEQMVYSLLKATRWYWRALAAFTSQPKPEP